MTEAPYGLWESPLSPARMAGGVTLTDVAWDDETGQLVWHEERSGVGVLMAAGAAGEGARQLTVEHSVRAAVGYGGGDFTVQGGQVYYVSREGRLYRKPLGKGVARALTPAFGAAASPQVSPDGRWVVFVHSYEGRDVLAIVDVRGERWPQELVDGADFYAQPAWHPSGRMLAFVSWNHPRMPWDGSELRLAHLEEGPRGLPVVSRVETVAGGDDVEVFQPAFSPDGRWLAYVSDETGWANLHLCDLETGRSELAHREEAEHGLRNWRQGMRTLGWSPGGGAVYFLRSREGRVELWAYDLAARRAHPVPVVEGEPREGKAGEERPGGHPAGYTVLQQLAVDPGRGRIALLASSPAVPRRVVVMEPGRPAAVVARSQAEDVPDGYFSWPEHRRWIAPDGGEVHGLFYRPANPQYTGKGRPPLVVRVHGGPTSQATPGWAPEVAFMTSRGYAVLDVDYRGSAGYGRAYREALKGRWGVLDVEDAVSGAARLAQEGLVDRERMVIMGGSAGGYTVLRALAEHPGFFRAGVSASGVTDLFLLASQTHKFEAHYTDSLVGPLPEAAAAYRERSPLFAADRIRDPLAIFQGDEDRVVPRSQADALVEALRRRGVPHEYHVYPGEGHGWRKRETVEAYYAALEAFLRRYVVFA
ncbi:S9 family peptidase [Carboxydochorda subterranea]|uniref:S9 family peptidase n=1 Tax=Carboxydichorda subterranea TaxID=3109565 RepID=A0ABZ1BVS4_9FIRM|nr:S9 family peptidase [Limnochorda sp. L945t]WRP16877.1 S9 family peptidase [Limnochorda sp. L945t]